MLFTAILLQCCISLQSAASRGVNGKINKKCLALNVLNYVMNEYDSKVILVSESFDRESKVASTLSPELANKPMQ